MAITNVNIIKPIVADNVVTSLGEHTTGDHIVLKGDESSNSAQFTLNNSANTFGTTIKSAEVSSDITFTFPTADGSPNQVMVTDGNGNLSFSNDNNTTVLIEDTSPQLGGNLDVNDQSIVSVSNGNISFLPNGTGKVLIDGDGTTGGISFESGSIDVKNSGAVSLVRLYCESSNLHYTQLQSAPHSSYSGNVTLTLPTTSGTLLTQTEAQNLIGGAQDFVATGTIATGDIVGLRSDGTVEVITDTTNTQTENAGTPVVFESATTTDISSTFDSSQNKIVIAYRDGGNSNYGTAVVGTVSGSSISFGTPVVFESAGVEYTSATFDSSQNKVVIAYRDGGNSNYGTAIVGTVSGTSISFGSPVVFESASTVYISATFDSTSNKVIIAYRDGENSGYGTAVVGTVSGTSISFGTPVVFESAGTELISATFDSSQNKVVIAYRDGGNSNYGTAIVGTVSGNSISFGTSSVFSLSTSYISATFDSSQNKVVIAYRDNVNSNYGTAKVGTVSGTSISFGTPVVFESAITSNIYATFDSSQNKIVIAYRDNGNSSYGTARVGTVSGTSISFGTPVVFESANTAFISAAFDSSQNKIVIAYRDAGNSNFGTAVVYTPPGTVLTTNAASWIGIAKENISNTATGKINIIGGVAEGLSSLTVNTDYFVNYDGTLTATENAGPVTGTYGKIGRAISTTKLLITEGN